DDFSLLLLYLISLPPCLSAVADTSTQDYESLRIGGLAFAVVLFTLGILLILSKLTSVCACDCVSFYNVYIHAM
uniref:FXYD domain-containing ion transport regulator n=1 Tax=Myripristis murdjan TaxID=586833 RepID=A0A667Y5X8_9TELE